MNKILSLIRQYRGVILYLFFGALTTAVNYLVYLPCYNLWNFSAVGSNAIAWVVAVIFAFLTNKPFVFQSRDWSAGTVLPEMGKFALCRVGSGLLESGALFLTVDYMGWNGNWMKLLFSVVVVILNYVGSKLLVFRKRKNENSL